MKNSILEITDTGDPSVGIFARSFEIQCPFSEQEIDKEDADWFKTKMIELYREFCEGAIIAEYDFEPKEID